MQHKNVQGSFLRRAQTLAFAGVLATAMIPFNSAYAVTSSDLRAEADSIMQRINAMQTDLNEANAQYSRALTDRDAAQIAMNDAEVRIKENEERITELQNLLSGRASTMYKNGDTSFLDVLLGASSFTEFLTLWDSFDRIAQQNSDMVNETKNARQAAEQARKEYEEQRNLAQDKMNEAQTLAGQIEAQQASLQQEVDRISAEAAELQAQEEAQAEEARRAAEAAAAAQAQISSGGGGYGAGSSGPGAPVISGSGTFAHPCPSGVISSSFGYRDFDASFHKGTDFAAPEGTPYYAAESGTVIIAGYSASAGNWIVISHGNGLITKYMHSSAIFVSAGQQVTKGQHIGNVGNTGQSFGAHLHFQVEVNASSWSGTAVDPLLYL